MQIPEAVFESEHQVSAILALIKEQTDDLISGKPHDKRRSDTQHRSQDELITERVPNTLMIALAEELSGKDTRTGQSPEDA